MGSKTVEIIFGKDGSIVGEAIGFKGPACEEKTEFLKKEFGSSTTVRKASYDEVEETESTKIVDGFPSGHCGQGAIMTEIFKKHHNDNFVLCGGQDCPFCEAGFPRKLIIPFF